MEHSGKGVEQKLRCMNEGLGGRESGREPQIVASGSAFAAKRLAVEGPGCGY